MFKQITFPENARAIYLPEAVAGALEVCADCYGTGDTRKKKLREAGYDPDEVQACVNDLFPILKKWGFD